MKKGKIVIQTDRCKGCAFCVEACPRKCIAISKAINKRGVHPAEFINEDECIACSLCAKFCPDVCIEVWDKEVTNA